MKIYNAYKESGLLWIGEIPEKWIITSFKNLLYKVYGGGTPNTSTGSFWADDDQKGIPWIAISDISKSNGILNKTSKKITEEGLKSKGLEILPIGTLLMSIFASLGKTTRLGVEATINQAILGLVPNNKLEVDFLEYLLIDAERYISFYSSMSTQENLNLTKIKNLKFPIPTIGEQTQIAKYLGHKTQIIDSLIEKKEQLIKKLQAQRQAIINEAVTKGLNLNAKMKDSGIDSFGMIPNTWNVTKLKYISNIKGRIGFRGYKTDDLVEKGNGALTLGASHITWDGDINLSNPVYIKWEKYDESPEIQLDKNDIIIVQRGSTCGKVAIISEEIGKATINPSLVVLKNVNANSFYVFSSIKSALVELTNLTRSAAIPMLSQEQIGNLQIVFPPRDEQIEIEVYLKETNEQFTNVLSKCLVTIKKLKSYRQSIISEAVTGKIDVRDWQPKTT